MTDYWQVYGEFIPNKLHVKSKKKLGLLKAIMEF